jgi:glycosyltransferase involved in cell wall biosynthesis/2-polyprenyl-3-methyl-5-hydroxy-6-metoxy-1,4-benzoquinol methylase
MHKYDRVMDPSDVTSNSLVLRQLEKGAKVLEFGPSTGYMTQYMKEQLDCSVTCVEIDEEAAKKASIYCERMIIADLEKLEWFNELKDETFDSILFVDVLEHLRNPEVILAHAVKLLNPNGKIYFSIPHIAHSAILLDLLDEKFIYRKVGLLDETHVKFFTKESILQLLNFADLAPIHWNGTISLPRDTEFSRSYESLPFDVQRILMNRSNAHVYQFIIVAKRTADITLNEKVDDFVISGGSPVYNCAQVFWSENGIYQSEKSIILPIHTVKKERQQDHLIPKEENWHTYEFLIPPEASGSLRLDPVSWPSEVVIRRLTIKSDSTNSILLDITPNNGFTDVEVSSGIVILQKEKLLHLAALEQDIQLYIPLPEHQDGFMRFSLEMQVKEENIISAITESLNIQVEEKIRLQDELEAMKASRVWRLSLKLRYIKSVLKRIFGALQHFLSYFIVWTVSVRLIPWHELKPSSNKNEWISEGEDPYFVLDSRGFLSYYPSGWVKFRWKGGLLNQGRETMTLYWDNGMGMNEHQKATIGVLSRLPNDTNVNEDGLQWQTSLLHFPKGIRIVRLDPGNKSFIFNLSSLQIKKISRLEMLFSAVRTYFQVNGKKPSSIWSLIRKGFQIISQSGVTELWKKVKNKSVNILMDSGVNYSDYIEANRITNEKGKAILLLINQMKYKPTFSVILPVYNVEEIWLRKCIDSVINQIYPYWELCIADDASPSPHIRRVLEEYSQNDSRIKVVYREKNGHISETSNSALEVASGEFIALLDHDDELTLDALFENAKLLNEHPDADMIYSDEDKITPEGFRHGAFFKPDWSPDMFLSHMYSCHLGVYRLSIVREIGHFRKGFEGSQDYDLVLRFTEKTNQIHHIPKVLYHWRTIPQSTASGSGAKNYTVKAGFRALEETVKRRGINGWVEPLHDYPNLFTIHYNPTNYPLVSILIPTKNMAKILGNCLDTIFEKTDYPNFEVIVMDNGSTDIETITLFERWLLKEPERFLTVRMDVPFNYSYLNNEAAKLAKGELLLLLNNDVEVITPGWISEMVGQAIRPTVGAVGACLLYPDNTHQHGGILLGVAGIANHSHRHFDFNNSGYFSRLKTVSNYSAVTGACLMVQKSIYWEVNGLEDELTVAYNDVDFCLKLRELGYYNVWLPQVQLYHHESKSRGYDDSPEKMARLLFETEWMQKRWGDSLEKDPFYNPNLTRTQENFALRPVNY